MNSEPTVTVNEIRKPIFGISSIVSPILAFGIAWIRASTHLDDQVEGGLGQAMVFVGTCALGTFFGTIFALIAIFRQERWWWVRSIGLIINGFPLFTLLLWRFGGGPPGIILAVIVIVIVISKSGRGSPRVSREEPDRKDNREIH